MYVSPKYERVEILSADVITVSGVQPSYAGTNCEVYEGQQSVFGNGTATQVAANISSILRN